MSRLKALRWLALFGLITVIWPVSRANATLYEILTTPTFAYGDLSQDDLENGSYYLGPIAAVNSFIYLQNRYPAVYGDRLVHNNPIGTAITLGGSAYMKTNSSGTQVPDFYWGTNLYMEDTNQVPAKTIYAGETIPQTWPEGRPKPAWVTERDSGPSWQFLYNELVKGADVELLLALSGVGVYVTLTCFHFEDDDNNGIITDGEKAWIKYIDPDSGVVSQNINIWNDSADVDKIVVNQAGSFITMAASERPVPLPSSLLLFGSGLIGLWRLGRKISAN